jgi:hypothetical protein
MNYDAPMGRCIVGGFVGLVAGSIVIGGLEALGRVAVSVPKDVDPTTLTAESIPTMAFVVVLIAWACGSWVAGWTTTKVGRATSYRPALVVGLVLTLAGITNLLAIPSPIWFWILGLATFVPFTLFGHRVGSVART